MYFAADPTPTSTSFKPEDYGPNGSFNPGTPADELLGYFAWSVTAAAVAGLMIIGIQMSLRLRHGEMGEGATYYRGGFIIMGACVLGVSAGPLISWVVKPFLLK
ncbi:hypothetical protein [Streptomyces sp. RP5T]|uniref:hypothetical protein n=1 Tax=Streptomyces sp. RP5T TaxID=2490848 RepID=UPI000F6498AD|nr:hypothetical protein [Streptomyces sp. RP5T]RRR86552.1 hypothetical protein EHS43_04045 [Streptomyces sp. RP5T]